MSILKSDDGKELIVTCSCGCDDGVHIRIDKDMYDDYAYFTYINSNFYHDQEKTIGFVIKQKLKKIWTIIRNKDFYYSDIRMTKKDFEVFREYINSIK